MEQLNMDKFLDNFHTTFFRLHWKIQLQQLYEQLTHSAKTSLGISLGGPRLSHAPMVDADSDLTGSLAQMGSVGP